MEKPNGLWKYVLTSMATAIAVLVFNSFMSGITIPERVKNLETIRDKTLPEVDQLKMNNQTIVTQLIQIDKRLEKIEPIEYKWNKKSGMETEHTYAGFSAQNVKKVIPLGVGENKDGYLSLQDRAIMAALINAVKELSSKNDSLQVRIIALEKK